MNERFIRCSECGLPHQEGVLTCPSTGRPIVRSGSSPGRSVPPVRVPAPPAAPPPPPRASFQGGGRAGRDASEYDLVGSLIGGRYRVRDILGQGGMGTVYEALREGLGNLVAIKVLHPNQLHKKDAVQRFHHEARAAALIGHPNICEVYDVGSLDDGRPYLVMDRLTGVTLAEQIQTVGGLPFQDVLDTLTQVLSGLHAAHEKGIIHRDVKPENVFLSQRVGCPPLAKILDFGVSKVMAGSPQASGFSDAEVTRTGVVLGTPYYLAPEQARGERNLDARVDLYACGVMLYEALTGRRPFRAPNYNALLIAILTTAPRPAREIRSDLPAGFGKIIERAMARDSADRYQDALEFQAALQPYSHNPHLPRTKPPSRPPPRRSVAPVGSEGGAPVLPPAAALPRVGRDDMGVEDVQELLESAPSEEVLALADPPRPPAASPAPTMALPMAPALPRPGRGSVVPPRPTSPPAPLPPRPSTPPPFRTQPPPRPSTPPPFRTQPPPLPRLGSSAERAPPTDPRVHPAPGAAIGTRSQHVDDQATEVDLPRPFGPGRRAPVLGPPLKPPEALSGDETTATEIMSVAVRSELAPKRESSLPPRPEAPRPPRR